MPPRAPTPAPLPHAPRRIAATVDVVLVTPAEHRLTVLLLRRRGGRGRDRWHLPWTPLRQADALDAVATHLAASAGGRPPALIDQIGAFTGPDRREPASDLSVGFLAVAHAGNLGQAPAGAEWFPIDALPPLTKRQGAIVEGAQGALSSRLDASPIAFRLLPPVFTLSQLQEVYELLLRRRLHKASFRRALHAARLAEPTGEWRSEGRGRPAQLFRYAPRKRRGRRRGVRFEGLI